MKFVNASSNLHLVFADVAQDCTEREIKAVDSEHKKNIQSDPWASPLRFCHSFKLTLDSQRFFQMEKHIYRADHPYHKFGTGNYKTLWSTPKAAGRDPRQQLIEWWAENYCARRMKLSVIGKEDLETLEKMVQERFEAVPVKTEGRPQVGVNGVRVAFEDHPIGPEHSRVSLAIVGPSPRSPKQLVTVTKPVQDSRGLEITFPFPDLDHLYQSKVNFCVPT